MNSGNSFIDDNHYSLLTTIDEITILLRDGWSKEEFAVRVKNFITDMERHFSHEELILKAARYTEMDSHILKHRELLMRLRMDGYAILNYDAALQFIMSLRTLFFSHELFEDQKYWFLFEQEDSAQDQLIFWSKELETGDLEIDKHHKAIINHLNRFHRRMSDSPDIDFACKDLKQIYEYSKFHFKEEEVFLGKKILPGHKENHESLLADLNVVIDEVRSGKSNIENIGGYLKFWLINHIKNFDIPSFNRGV